MTESYDLYASVIPEQVHRILKQEFLPKEYPVDMKTMKLIVDDAVCIYNTKSPIGHVK